MADLENLRRTYQQMPDGKLLELAQQADTLTPAARSLLTEEIDRRGITGQPPETENADAEEQTTPASEDLLTEMFSPSDAAEPASDEFTVVYSAEDEQGAERAQALLRAEGIESRLQIVILVSNADSEKALEILSDKPEADSA